MKEVPRQEWAKRLLEDQIERLGELRNANPRDQSFKLWRQTTLTVIQRLWPGDLPKSEAFRRIAFSTPSARATRNQVRQHYERGVAEAVSYLRGLMLEIDGGALALGAEHVSPIDGAEPTPPMAPEPPPDPSRDNRALDEGLVGSGPLGSLGPPQPISTGPPLKFTSPAFERDPEFRPVERGAVPSFEPRVTPAPAPAPVPPPVIPNVTPAPPPPPPPPERVAAVPAAPPVNATAPEPAAQPQEPVAENPPLVPSHPRRPEKRALKEMLGFVDSPSPHRGGEPTVSPDIISTRSGSSAGGPGMETSQVPPPERRDWPEPAAAQSEPEDVDETEDVDEVVEVNVDMDDDVDTVLDEGPDPFERDELEVPQPAQEVARPDSTELLRNSPLFAAHARMAKVPPPAGPRGPASSTTVAAVLKALAADLTRLGVPEGQRAATRAALIGLGRQFDQGTATWSSVRQTFVMALEYPALARLLIPSLIPYLDLE